MTFLARPLMMAGWFIGQLGDGDYVLRPSDGWPRGWPPPRIVACPRGRRLWWHWAAPVQIAGVPIAQVADADRALLMLLGTLTKLAARAAADGAPPP